MADEGEIGADELVGMKPPKLDQQVIEPLTDVELQTPIKACTGKDLRDRRDEAIVRFMAETGTRAGETAMLKISDISLASATVIIRKGKGGKGPQRFDRHTGRVSHRPVRPIPTYTPTRLIR